MRFLISLLFIVIGITFIISGEADDSPGLQGIGLILIISVLVSVYRRKKSKWATKFSKWLWRIFMHI